MKYLIILALTFTTSLSTKGGSFHSENSFIIRQQPDTIKAKPIGGMKNFYQKWNPYSSYTKEAKKKKVEGRIHVKFIVNEDGTLSNFEITKSLGYGLDEITIEAIKKCGNWNPKKINGKAVSGSNGNAIYV